ncbi:MAG TPA: hypothetical protein PK926_15610 [Spirochaetota bacterium]|nr:hypothetical protein [Spirochaetota bacterium]HPI90900.1 hypothetical protein [Spirochaetota bacterium]HPR48382.1 hypothetical protein [Spirochaetota bacterium]
MSTHYFWDIENVSFHNLHAIMDHVAKADGAIQCHVVFAKIKEARKEALMDHGWQLTSTEGCSRNSADIKIKEMIEALLDNAGSDVEKIVIITEDSGFLKIGRRIIEEGIDLEVICATKDPAWVRELASRKKNFNRTKE